MNTYIELKNRDALGLTYEEVKADDVMYGALQRAMTYQNNLDF